MLSSNLRLRVLSAAVLAPPVLASVIVGPPFFDGVLLVACVILSVEWSKMTDFGRFRLVGWVMASVVAFGFVGWRGLAVPVGWVAVLAAAAIGPVAFLAWHQRCKEPLWLALGIPVIVLPAVALDWLRNVPVGGMALVLWVMLVVWATDIGAYASGRTIGGPKLAPRISPQKTWAGLGGGMVWAALVGVGFALPLGASVVRLVGVSAGLAILAQGGDLAESMVKRRFQLKDSSALIPGHGGLLDRVDGLLTVAPTVLLLVWLLGDPLLP